MGGSGGGPPPPSIGFAPGFGADAFTSMPRNHHAAAHRVEAGVLPRWNPPYLFEPSKMPCSVWACCSASGIEVEPPGLDDSFGYVGRDVLLKLHREVVDLVSGRATT